MLLKHWLTAPPQLNILDGTEFEITKLISTKKFTKTYTGNLISDLLPKGQVRPTSFGSMFDDFPKHLI